MPFEVITLRNGARAIRDQLSGEVMHPALGPWAEARALYVEQTRLAERLKAETAEPLRIWDVGLGGAANAAAALDCARSLDGGERRRALELVSFEVDLEPLRLALEDAEGFPFLVDWRQAARSLVERGAWEAEGIRWTLHLGDALKGFERAPGPPELVFHDPFSPESNPTLWSAQAFRTLRARCREDGPGTTLVTYSASTRTRVAMLLGGFFVGVGDATGTKKETTAAATRPELLARPLDQRWLERWTRSSARGPWGEELTPAIEQAISAHAQFAAGRLGSTTPARRC